MHFPTIPSSLSRRTVRESSLPLSGRHILIVEDDMMQAWRMGDIVSERGGAVPTVIFDLERARTALDKEFIDCAVIDVNLNGTLSFPLAEELRRRGIPFLFCTAYADAVMVHPSAAEVPRLDKPVIEAELINTLVKLLRVQAESENFL